MTPRATPAEAGDRPAWDAFVTARPEADVLQLWAWGDIVGAAGETRGRRHETPERILVRAEDGRVRGVAQILIRRAALGRSVLYVPRGPVWEREAADGSEVLAALLDGLRAVARSRHGIVVKLDPRAALLAPPAAEPDDASVATDPDAPRARDAAVPKGNTVATDADAVALALASRGLRRVRFDLQAPTTRIIAIESDETARIAGWSSGARNLWRRAAREGTETTVARTADPEAVTAFSDLHARAAGQARFRTRPPEFFAALAAELAPAGGLHVAVSRWRGRPIAAMFVAGVGDRAFYLYGASDREAPSEANGSYAAMGASLEALAEDGVATLDLWGVAEEGDPRSDPSWAGFSAFKRKFGGVSVRHPGTFDLVIDPVWWSIREIRERLGLAR